MAIDKVRSYPGVKSLAITCDPDSSKYNDYMLLSPETPEDSVIMARSFTSMIYLAVVMSYYVGGKKEKIEQLKDYAAMQKQMGEIEERNRIAREIHDNVGHLLSRALIQTGAVIAVSRDEQTKPLLLSIKETLDCAMNNIRNSVHDLHDESVDLEQTVREMTEKAEGYTVSYEYDMSQDLPKELKYCIISIVKEALSNVTRHSDADRVKLLLREHPAFYQILIQDNGKCVHPGDGTGIGITNMRQRVETFGGTIDIRTENGYRIFIHIPKADIPAGR